MNLWTVREAALRALQAALVQESDLLDKAFQQAEYLSQRLDAITPDTPFSRITALTTAKARNLAQACYSLALDGLAQESGAILRVWVEAAELLTYLRLEPSRAEQAFEGTLPSPGERARKIGAFTRKMRESLNATASHLAFEPASWLHVINLKTGRVRTRQEFSPAVLRTNMGVLFAILTWTVAEAALCLNTAQGFIEASIAKQIDKLKEDGFALFHPQGIDEARPDF